MNKMDVLDSLHYLARLSRRFYSREGYSGRSGNYSEGHGDRHGRGHGRNYGGGRGGRGGHRHASHSEMKLLNILKAEDAINARDLAERLDIRPSSLSEALDRLEKRGVIERSRDEKDSRVYWIKLTESGRNEMENHFEEHNKARLEIEECLTEEEKKTFLLICEKLSTHLISLTSNSTLGEM